LKIMVFPSVKHVHVVTERAWFLVVRATGNAAATSIDMITMILTKIGLYTMTNGLSVILVRVVGESIAPVVVEKEGIKKNYILKDLI